MLHPPARLDLLALLALAVTLAACRRDAEEKTAAAPAPAPAAAPVEVTTSTAGKPRRFPRLREDEAAGRKASEQWDEHQEEEERNRRRCFDQDRRTQHQKLLAALGRLRASYDGAKTKADLSRVQAQAAREVPALRKQVDEIDPWQNSSLLLADYTALLDLLAQPAADLRQIQSEIAGKLQALKLKLDEAEECEHEE